MYVAAKRKTPQDQPASENADLSRYVRGGPATTLANGPRINLAYTSGA